MGTLSGRRDLTDAEVREGALRVLQDGMATKYKIRAVIEAQHSKHLASGRVGEICADLISERLLRVVRAPYRTNLTFYELADGTGRNVVPVEPHPTFEWAPPVAHRHRSIARSLT